MVQGMTVYIYGLYDPRDGALRYIGKTIGLKVRFGLHMSETRNTHKNQWLRQLRELGLKPEMRVLETIENSNDLDWQDRERWWIASSREAGLPITNLDSGGRNGMRKSPETCARIAASNTGKKMAPESVAKMIATKAANMTPELRQKLSLSNLGRRHSQEVRAARSLALTGRVVSEETRRKIGLANRGTVMSEETKAKLRAARALQAITPETRAKLSAIFKGRKPSPQTIAASVLASRGRVPSEETRARMRASRAAYFARKAEALGAVAA